MSKGQGCGAEQGESGASGRATSARLAVGASGKTSSLDASETVEQKLQKKRTNNGAKRKTHPECGVETVVVEPDSPDFNP